MSHLEVLRASERFRTREEGRDSWHCFSFGDHYDPARTGFGLLTAVNEERLASGAGYAMHRHRDVEIVSWVLEGTLCHVDSTGRRTEIASGHLQRLSAGSGVEHSEHAGAAGVHFVQAWVEPERSGIAPSYEQCSVGAALEAGGWVTAAGPAGPAALCQRAAVLHVTRMERAHRLRTPAAAFVHLLVVRGDVDLAGGYRLTAGDSAQVTDSAGLTLTAVADSEVLCWAMQQGR